MNDERQNKRVHTNEDWYPTAKDGKLEVSFMLLTNGLWRVCVWGADDFGMERDFVDRDEALDIYNRINGMVNQKSLLRKGFVRA